MSPTSRIDGPTGKTQVPRPDELLQDVVLRGAAQLREVVAALLGHRQVHCDQDRRGAVDRQRHRDPVEVDTLERDLEVAQRVHGHADAADFALGLRIVRIQAALRRQVEGDVEPGLAVGDQVVEALVGLGRIAETRVLAHRPRLLPVHQRMDAARERVLAGLADHVLAAARRDVGRGVERPDLDPRFVDHTTRRARRRL